MRKLAYSFLTVITIALVIAAFVFMNDTVMTDFLGTLRYVDIALWAAAYVHFDLQC